MDRIHVVFFKMGTMKSRKPPHLCTLVVFLTCSLFHWGCANNGSGHAEEFWDLLGSDAREPDVKDAAQESIEKDMPEADSLGTDPNQDDLAHDFYGFDEFIEPVASSLTVHNLQRLGNVRGLAVTDDLSVIAVGDNGLVAHMRDEEFFFGPTPPDERDLFAIASKHGTTIAVGEKGLVLRLEGFGWEVLEAPTDTDLFGVAISDSDDFYVCGAKGQIFHFHKNLWTKEDTGITYNLYSIVTTPSGAIAAGDFGTVIELRAGIWQRQQVASPSSSLRGLFRTPDGVTFAVGTGGAVVVQKEGTWQLQITGDTYDPPRDLHAVFAFSSSEVYAVGDKGVVLKFNGKKWSLAPVAGPYNQFADLRAVWGLEKEDGEKKVIAMGLDSQGLIMNDKTFEDLNLAIGLNLYGVTFDPFGRVIAVGDKGIAFAFDGKRFFGIETSTNNPLRAASWPFAVGDKGILVEFEEGLNIRTKTKTVVPSDDLTDIDSSSDFAIAVSKQGSVFRIESGGITSDEQLLGNSLYCACIVDQSKVVLGADRGLLFILEEGTVRTVHASGAYGAIRDLYCDTSFFLAVGDYGLLQKCDYSSCVSLFTGPAAFFFSVDYNEGFGLVAGWAGQVIFLDSMLKPRSLDSPTLQTYRSVSIRGGVAALVGDSGLFVTSDFSEK